MAIISGIRPEEVPAAPGRLVRAQLDEVHRGGRTMSEKRFAPPPIPRHLVDGLSESATIPTNDFLPAREPLSRITGGCAGPGGSNGINLGDAQQAFLPRTPGLPTGSAERKEFPMCTGVLDYFPAALAEVAHVSWVGNQKHNPGQPLHHARGKSMDHPDCIVRHTSERGGWDRFEWTDENGAQQVRWVMHSAYVAWRALADLQQECEDLGASRARAAK